MSDTSRPCSIIEREGRIEVLFEQGKYEGEIFRFEYHGTEDEVARSVESGFPPIFVAAIQKDNDYPWVTYLSMMDESLPEGAQIPGFSLCPHHLDRLADIFRDLAKQGWQTWLNRPEATQE